MRASCTICCDLFDDVVSVAATSCGHTFHELCLLQWVEHSRTCPACRKHVSHKNIVRLFFTTVATDEQQSVDKVTNELDALKAELKLKQMEQRKMQTNMDELRSLVVKAELQYEEARDRLGDARSEIASLNLKLKTLTKELSGMEKVHHENAQLRQQLQHLKVAETIINGCKKDIEAILQQYSDTPAAKKQMATYCALLKMELQKAGDGKRRLQEELKSMKKELGYKSVLANSSLERIRALDVEVNLLRERLCNTRPDRTSPSAKRKKTENIDSSLTNDASASTNTLPVKKAKVNILSPTQNKTNEEAIEKNLNVGTSFFKPWPKSALDESVVSVGYDGLGGHGRHIVRSIRPLARVKRRKHCSAKENSSSTIDSFLFNHQ